MQAPAVNKCLPPAIGPEELYRIKLQTDRLTAMTPEKIETPDTCEKVVIRVSSLSIVSQCLENDGNLKRWRTYNVLTDSVC